MNLIPTLKEAQRTELQETAECLAKLRRKFASLAKQRADLEETKTKALCKLAAAETAADAGDEAASVKVLALRDQIARLNMTLGRTEREQTELEAEGNKAVRMARNEIRQAHAPLVKIVTEEVATLLAPYCEYDFHALAPAQELFAIGQLQYFSRKSSDQRTLASADEITAALDSLGVTVASLLAGEPVVTPVTSGDRRGFSFPAYCA